MDVTMVACEFSGEEGRYLAVEASVEMVRDGAMACTRCVKRILSNACMSRHGD